MYDHKKIDKKWQKIWKENKIYKTLDAQDKPKYYILDMFPYPSGAGLHVGHPKGYIATDVCARFKMMNGFNVLHPMGWDGFGLPTENYAIKNKVHPKIATEENIKRFKEQLEILGFTYDWDREINTTDPSYYKWTQWIFLQMFKRGMAYQSYEPINWCPSCKTGLANEDLEDGKCERCGSEIEQKPMRQWVLKITDYAEQLLDGLKDLDWEDSIIEMQKNWIGKSEGASVKFKVQSSKFKVEEESQINTKYKILDTGYFLEVFTTRPDTLFGCTYMVVCPEHNLISNFKFQISNLEEVEDYVKKTKNKTNLERTDLVKEKTGVEIKGIKAINPVNGEEIPIFVADYVLAEYGTGAIMAVPAHDERDFEFAKKYKLPIKQVVAPFFTTTEGKDAVRKDKPTIQRRTIYVLLKHWQENKYLCLDWKKFGWHSGIIGGIENNENIIEAAKREIKEETGYENVELIKNFGEIHNYFFAAHKNENRYAIGYGMLFRLIDDQKNDEIQIDTKNHEPVWIKAEEMESFLNLPVFNYMRGITIGNLNECFSGEGININSEFPAQILDNTKTPENSEAFDGIEDCCPRCRTTVCHLDNNIIYNKNKNVKSNNGIEPAEGLEPSDQQVTNRGQRHATGISTPDVLYQKNDNTKTSENSEAFDRDYFYPRCESGTCHSVNIISYINKNVKSNGIEPVEGLEPSDKEMTSSCPHHATGISTSSSLYQKSNNITKSLNGLPTRATKQKMIEWLEENGIGKREINYKLRDWVFSRQRYWGEPIPLIHCENCKNKKYNYIIIHGYGGSPEVNFFQWLKEELKKLGHTAVCPELPNTDEPNIDEQADYIINNIEINSDTILIGHSLGGAVVMRLLEKTNKKVSKVLFVDSFIEPNFDDVDREQVEKSADWNFNFKKIKSLSDEFVVLADQSYAVVPKDQPQKMAELFDATVIITNPKEWHFCGEQEPEILKLSLEQGVYPVPEKDLPLELPEVENYEPSGTGESPLANITEWVNAKCPKCGGPAKRETNTMPQWAGSCWYYLRYIDPKNSEKLVDPKKEKYWQPVDLYVGGAEHATRHLIYSRFWHHFLFDINIVSTPEPFTKLQHVGLIMAEDGRKMSKRWNNVINPDDVVEEYGADVMRVYEMFMGPFDNAIAWSTEGLVGSRRFLERVWKLKNKIPPHFAKGGWGDFQSPPLTRVEGVKKLELLLHKTIKKVTNDIQNFKFNTAISSIMILLNSLEREEKIDLKYYLTLLQLLSPFAPHITEELWDQLKNKESIFSQSWPKYDESLIKDEEIELVVQINGKIRDKISANADITEREAKELALSSEKIQQWLDGKEPKKIIFVKGKLISIVA